MENSKKVKETMGFIYHVGTLKHFTNMSCQCYIMYFNMNKTICNHNNHVLTTWMNYIILHSYT